MATVEELRLAIKAEVSDAVSKLKQFDRTTKDTSSGITKMGKTFASLRDIMQGPIAALQMLGRGVRQIDGLIMKAAESELAFSNLSSVLKSTGGESGMTMQSIQALTDELERTTLFEDELVMQSQAVLLTFRQIGSDVFPQATRAIADMAQFMKMDLQSATLAVGKALNDPIAGVTSLQRMGVKLTESQKAQVKGFVDVNDVASAQKVIINELNMEFGGAAKNAADTATGSYQQLKKALVEVTESIGTLLAGFVVGSGGKNITQWIFEIADGIKQIGDLSAGKRTAAGAKATLDQINEQIAAATAEVEKLKKLKKQFDDSVANAPNEHFYGIDLGYKAKKIDINNSEERLANAEELLKKLESAKAAQEAYNRAMAGSPGFNPATGSAKPVATPEEIAAAEAYKKKIEELAAAEKARWQAYFEAHETMAGRFGGGWGMPQETEGPLNKGDRNTITQLKDLEKELAQYGEGLRVIQKGTLDVTDATDAMNDELKLQEDLMKSLGDIFERTFVDAFEAVGKGLADQEDGFKSFKKVAVAAIAAVIEALSQQLLIEGMGMMFKNPVAGIGLMAASAMGFVAAGAVKAIPMAEGGSGVVTKPTLFLAGEKGPEPFAFGGTGNKRGMGGNTFIFHGSPWAIKEAKAVVMEAINESERGW
jgi:hypothetical protein